MSDRDWTPCNNDSPPPVGVVVETMNSGGQVTDLILQDGLFWFPDMSMYVYYTPQFWRLP